MAKKSAAGTTSRSRNKARILDIALQAGVSTATVDRVLNNRPGVRQPTIDAVHEAARMLDKAALRPTIIPTVSADITIDAVIAGNAGFANDMLSGFLQQTAREAGVTLRMSYPKAMDPEAQAEALLQCIKQGTSGIIVQALEHPSVRSAIEQVHAQKVPVTTILNQLPNSKTLTYVGLDNRAAGRSAALLMGRLLPAAAPLALVVGGPLYRCHEERETGFRTLLRQEFPHLTLLPVVPSLDNPNHIYQQLKTLLTEHPDLRGILNVGGGNRGIERALQETDRWKEIVYMCFNVTPLTRQLLLSGLLDVVVHQDMEKIARLAVKSIVDHLTGRTIEFQNIAIELVMKENL